ncbi:MAG: hypothetical protein D3904_00725 [Candidatus Electrothrix sp. EH2]|nr:hypothetical protein [Candidatus Electrothrix sp. EH2]
MITSPEQFYTEKVQPLEGKHRKLEDLVGIAESDLEKAKKYSKQWEECLKKREETKKQVEKERNNSFIPCFSQKKVKELDACVKCCRKTKACVLLKKQEVALCEGRKKLVEQRLALVKDDLKQAKDFWGNLKKIYKNNESLSSQLNDNLLPDKAERLLLHINCDDSKKSKYSEEELKEEVNKLLLCDGTTKVFDKEKEGLTFIRATRRIHDDFSIVQQKLMDGEKVNFVQQAIKRCELLREYDRKGIEFLDVLKREISSKSDLEKRKFVFDVKLKEYEKAVSDAQGNYKKAMELFAKIVMSPELNCSQKKCIEINSCRETALRTEKDCYERWGKNNRSIIDSQIKFVEKNGSCADSDEARQTHQGEMAQCAPMETPEEKYRNDMCCLDDWEASIPKYIWENLVRYEEARYLLSQVASIQCAAEEGTSEGQCMGESKKKVMEDALKHWVDAFMKGSKNDHWDHFIQHAHDLLNQQVAYAQKNSAERMKIAIQGGANTFIGRDLYKIIHEMKRNYCVKIPKNSEKTCCEPSGTSNSVTDPCNDLYELSCCPSIASTEGILLCDADPCADTPPCLTYKEKKICCDDNRTYPCIKNPICPSASLLMEVEGRTDDGMEDGVEPQCSSDQRGEIISRNTTQESGSSEQAGIRPRTRCDC